VGTLEDIIADLDLVLVMSVNPGFGGQRFIENTYGKLDALRELRARRGSRALIEVDGGVGPDNVKKLVQHGADVLVAGNSVFGTRDAARAIADLTQA
jgi:ribulose-phosphate 3-epimerase